MKAALLVVLFAGAAMAGCVGGESPDSVDGQIDRMVTLPDTLNIEQGEIVTLNETTFAWRLEDTMPAGEDVRPVAFDVPAGHVFDLQVSLVSPGQGTVLFSVLDAAGEPVRCTSGFGIPGEMLDHQGEHCELEGAASGEPGPWQIRLAKFAESTLRDVAFELDVRLVLQPRPAADWEAIEAGPAPAPGDWWEIEVYDPFMREHTFGQADKLRLR